MLNLLGLKIAHAAALSTTTLGTSIDTINTTWNDYFTVFMTNAWPFLLGASVLVGIVLLALALIRRVFHA